MVQRIENRKNRYAEICKSNYKEGEQLENYTKYKLKSTDELASLLADKDNLFVIACNKCFKEFATIDEPDCDEFIKFAEEQGTKLTQKKIYQI